MYKNGKNGNGHNPFNDVLRPHNPNAEDSTLGSIIIDNDKLFEIDLTPDDFYDKRRATVYEAIQRLYEKRSGIDLTTLMIELKSMGANDIDESYLLQLMNVTPTSIHAKYYADIVEVDSFRRKLLDVAGKIAKLAHTSTSTKEDMLSQAEQFLLNSLDDRIDRKTRFTDDIMGDVFDHLEKVAGAKNGISGIPTGLSDLDQLLGGLQKSDMIVIAARPGMGKTSLALQIAKNASKNHKKSGLLFSLEMGDEQLQRRLLSCESGVPSSVFRTGKINNKQWETLFDAKRKLSSMPLAINDNASLAISQMRSIAIRHKARYGLDYIIIDYIQLMQGESKGNTRYNDVTDISRAIKCLARDLDIPVIALSQLSRKCEERADKRPMLSDLRESGAIEADADIVLFLYRDEEYNPETQFPGLAELIIAKHRSGPTSMINVFFKKSTTQFVDLETRTQPLEQIV